MSRRDGATATTLSEGPDHDTDRGPDHDCPRTRGPDHSLSGCGHATATTLSEGPDHDTDRGPDHDCPRTRGPDHSLFGCGQNTDPVCILAHCVYKDLPSLSLFSPLFSSRNVLFFDRTIGCNPVPQFSP